MSYFFNYVNKLFEIKIKKKLWYSTIKKLIKIKTIGFIVLLIYYLSGYGYLYMCSDILKENYIKMSQLINFVLKLENNQIDIFNKILISLVRIPLFFFCLIYINVKAFTIKVVNFSAHVYFNYSNISNINNIKNYITEFIYYFSIENSYNMFFIHFFIFFLFNLNLLILLFR